MYIDTAYKLVVIISEHGKKQTNTQDKNNTEKVKLIKMNAFVI